MYLNTLGSFAIAWMLCLAALPEAGADASVGLDDLDQLLGQPQVQNSLEAAGLPMPRPPQCAVWLQYTPAGYVFGLRDKTNGTTCYLTADGTLVDPASYAAFGLVPVAVQPLPFVTDTIRPAEVGPKASVQGPLIYPLTTPPTEYLTPIIEPELFKDGLEGPEKSMFVTGGVVFLEEPLILTGNAATDGTWQTTPEGQQVWSINMVALGALGQRIHFAEIALPEGATLTVSNEGAPDEAFALEEGTDQWSPTCFSEGVILQCAVPERTALDALRIVVDKYVYQFVDPIAAIQKQAGSCNNDTSCFPQWEDEVAGVALWGTLSSQGNVFFACTGTLLADNDPRSNAPFFLTANHCVSRSNTASAMEFFWFFEREGCNTGAVPNRLTVPRTTGGADLLFTASDFSGTDVSLLRIRQTPPAGVSYVGFSTVAQPVGTAVTCIHHPRSDYKRISFGSVTNAGSPLGGGSRIQPASRFHEVVWNDGTTEPASSGSPLFNTATRRVIGQLYGGRASCSLPNEPDYYGRFDVSYNLLFTFLNPLDLNRSGAIDAGDLQVVVDAALNSPNAIALDLNDSGRVDASDVQFIVDAILNPPSR